VRVPCMGRRRLLELGGAALLTGCPRSSSQRVLVLGGTGWIGPHVVRVLVAHGHRVTLFNRGHTDPLAFPEFEQLRGDRGGDLSALGGRAWDSVVDLSGTHPAWVRESARRLAGLVDHYLLMSSTAAYAGFDRLPVDESLPLREPAADAEYGARKADCEREAEAALPGRVCLPRSVYAVGAGDPDARLDAWLTAVATQPTLHLPGSPDAVILFVDVVDLAAFVVTLLEARAVGPFNVANRITAGDLVAACAAAVRHDPELRWNTSGEDPPPMLHASEGALRHWGELDTRRARDHGFAPRPIADTLAGAWPAVAAPEASSKHRSP
jgi:2'-hydroxyisoflavone reductase